MQIIRQLGLKDARNSFDGLRGDLFNSKFRMEGMAFALINKKINYTGIFKCLDLHAKLLCICSILAFFKNTNILIIGRFFWNNIP